MYFLGAELAGTIVGSPLAVPLDMVDIVTEGVIDETPITTGIVVTCGTIMNVELPLVVRAGIEGRIATSVLLLVVDVTLGLEFDTTVLDGVVLVLAMDSVLLGISMVVETEDEEDPEIEMELELKATDAEVDVEDESMRELEL